eukprot:COSAG01_NODE_13736_length_1542_cov_5.205821_2_plen_70_part_00
MDTQERELRIVAAKKAELAAREKRAVEKATRVAANKVLQQETQELQKAKEFEKAEAKRKKVAAAFEAAQ